MIIGADVYFCVKRGFLCVVMGFYARSVWGFEAIVRVLLEVWLGFQLLS